MAVDFFENPRSGLKLHFYWRYTINLPNYELCHQVHRSESIKKETHKALSFNGYLALFLSLQSMDVHRIKWTELARNLDIGAWHSTGSDRSNQKRKVELMGSQAPLSWPSSSYLEVTNYQAPKTSRSSRKLRADYWTANVNFIMWPQNNTPKQFSFISQPNPRTFYWAAGKRCCRSPAHNHRALV